MTNQLLFTQANLNNYPIQSSLDRNSLKTFPILKEIKQLIQELYQDQLDKIILFGSRARGDNHFQSDFDILIVLKKDFNYSQEIERTSHFLANLSLKFDLVISRVFVHSNDFKSKNTPFFLNIRREGIILWKKNKNIY